MPSFARKHAGLLGKTESIALTIFLFILSFCPAKAQSFDQHQAARQYKVNFIIQSQPIFGDGDYACAVISQAIEENTGGVPGRYEYTNPRYYPVDSNGYQGCLYDVVAHGGIGGHPEGYVEYNQLQGNWVFALYSCPAGSILSTQSNPDGSSTKICTRGLVSESKPSCPIAGAGDKWVGNPVSCGTGKKIEHVRDASFGSFSLERNFRSGMQSSMQYSDQRINLEMGEGWHSTLTAQLSFTPASPYAAAAVQAFRPDGSVVPFLLFPGSGWKSEADLSAISLSELLDSSNVRTGWKIVTPDGSIEYYDSKGHISALEQNGVRIISMERDASGRLVGITDSTGRKATVAHDNKYRISGITLPDGQSVAYVYDSQNRMTSVSRGGTITGYQYADIAGVGGAFLSGIIDENNATYAEFGYDSSGRAILSKHATNVESHSLVYRNGGNAVDVTFPSGRTETYEFDLQMASRKLASSTTTCSGCVSTTQTTTYDANGFPNVRIDRLGVSTDSDYNADGLLVQQIEAANNLTGKKRTTQTDWHATFRVPTERRVYNSANTLVAKSTYTYNTRGQALTASQIDPVSSVVRTTTTTYCESSDVTAGTCPLVGLVISINGARTDVADTTTYTYRLADEASCATAPTTCPYRKGDLWKVTNALGQITETLAFDGAGRVLSVKDANGVITDMTYHPRGWLTARKVRGANAAVETDDAITQIEYWPTGLVKKVIQPEGAFTSYAYDAAHRLTDIADNAGNTIHYTLDNAGNRTQEDTKDPGNVLKRTLSRVYNQLGQLQTQADAQANPTDFAYDANGNTDTVTDALGRVTDNNYDPLNRLSRTLQDVGGIEAQTQFQYDAQDNLTQVTDPKGLNTTYTYNGLGDLTQLASPDTGTTVYTYDSAGNRATQTDARSQTSTYSYDALNRLTGIAYATSSLNVGYTYDTTQAACQSGETFSAGRLTQLTDASGSTQYCYDRFGNLVRKVQTTNGVALTVRYAYTLAGQLSSVTYPDGAVATYTRDAQGRTTQVNVQRAGAASEVLLNQASYHPFGPVAGWTYGNGRQLLRPLNQNYQPTAIHDAGTGGLSVGFQYDPVGNLTQLTPAASPTPQVKFDYDALSRLTKFKDGPTDVAIESYAYDATGNRQSFTNSVGTQAYTYPSTNHRLSQVGATARSYDAAGNTTAIGGIAKEFVYDDTGRMTQVKQNAIVQRNYAYNGKGEQVHKYAGTANTYTLYDEAGHWLGDYDNTGTALQQAIWLDDLPVGLIANGNQLHYIEPDHLGTPRVVIEVARNVPVWTWDLKSEAFGNSVPAQDPDGDATPLVFDMRFPGQRYDATSGLNYNYFREYDTSTGRYAESDPIGQIGGLSTYGYVLGSPIFNSDFYGLRPDCRPEARPDGGYNPLQVFRETNLEVRSSPKLCIPIPTVSAPSPPDFFPDPIKWRRGRWPFGLPMSFGLLCETNKYRKYAKQQKTTMRMVNELVCYECGVEVSRMYMSDYFITKWNSVGTESEYWTEREYHAPGTY